MSSGWERTLGSMTGCWAGSMLRNASLPLPNGSIRAIRNAATTGTPASSIRVGADRRSRCVVITSCMSFGCDDPGAVNLAMIWKRGRAR